jgi:hypothetical protein
MNTEDLNDLLEEQKVINGKIAAIANQIKSMLDTIDMLEEFRQHFEYELSVVEWSINFNISNQKSEERGEE